MQEGLGALAAAEQVEPEIRCEYQCFEQHEGPHVRLSGHELGGLVLILCPLRATVCPGYEVGHCAASARSDCCFAGRLGSGPVPKSSRWTICLSRKMKTPV